MRAAWVTLNSCAEKRSQSGLTAKYIAVIFKGQSYLGGTKEQAEGEANVWLWWKKWHYGCISQLARSELYLLS